MGYRTNASELDQLAADLANNVDRLAPEVDRVVERGALNIRRDARRRIREQVRGVYLPHYPRSITYDMDSAPGRYAEAEIGPESGKKQGGMGPGVEYGSARGAPLPHLMPAYEAELPKLLKHLRRVVGEVLR
jgi:hypothetical protein